MSSPTGCRGPPRPSERRQEERTHHERDAWQQVLVLLLSLSWLEAVKTVGVMKAQVLRPRLQPGQLSRAGLRTCWCCSCCPRELMGWWQL